MATKIQPSVGGGEAVGGEDGAGEREGKAKMECSHLIISRVVRVRVRIPAMMRSGSGGYID